MVGGLVTSFLSEHAPNALRFVAPRQFLTQARTPSLLGGGGSLALRSLVFQALFVLLPRFGGPRLCELCQREAH
ncbi:MAG TPA: hypothetical protein VGL19_19250 [Polyangiaceae bacterium]